MKLRKWFRNWTNHTAIWLYTCDFIREFLKIRLGYIITCGNYSQLRFLSYGKQHTNKKIILVIETSCILFLERKQPTYIFMG